MDALFYLYIQDDDTGGTVASPAALSLARWTRDLQIIIRSRVAHFSYGLPDGLKSFTTLFGYLGLTA